MSRRPTAFGAPMPPPVTVNDVGPITIAALLAALLAWYESSQSQERNAESGYDLTRYRPKPRAW